MSAKSRVGVFTLSSNLTKEELSTVFNYLSCIPLEVRYLPWLNKVEYTVVSDKFDEVEEGCIPSEYEIVTEYNEFDDGFDVKVQNKLANKGE